MGNVESGNLATSSKPVSPPLLKPRTLEAVRRSTILFNFPLFFV